MATATAAPPKLTGHPALEQATQEENTNLKIAVAILATAVGLFVFFFFFWPHIRWWQKGKAVDAEQGIEMNRQEITRRSPPLQQPGAGQNELPEQPREVVPPPQPARVVAPTHQDRRVPVQNDLRQQVGGSHSVPQAGRNHHHVAPQGASATYVPSQDDQYSGFSEVDLGQKTQTENSRNDEANFDTLLSRMGPLTPTYGRSAAQRRQERYDADKPRAKGYDADTGERFY
ncbi:hypothetical protein QBC33DRAFT_518681 [Phialemonium atrogriseum]|uniref:Uncharacterized protein n=1 Tax=Phialemonium atrogriseum TaxID=1093897 RepID=A0AAJ0BSM5_9PEZI|nr:uncharacterized protein QBC33DRAFT_518681 [Phialemonium atrogriseum]KAK1763307.1 hypothetical protein QBC33DRAFT_518681 [Phialemonium atrogriseum]